MKYTISNESFLLHNETRIMLMNYKQKKIIHDVIKKINFPETPNDDSNNEFFIKINPNISIWKKIINIICFN
tara:strand:+ start:242 stop:457 length:216 start_codon:yes stop_codon:yes gene_type:complete